MGPAEIQQYMEHVENSHLLEKKRERIANVILIVLGTLSSIGYALEIQSLFEICGALLISMAGIFSLFIGLSSLKQAWQCKKWPHTDGKILDSKIADDQISFLGHLFYKYQVANKEYIGHRVRIGGLRSTESHTLQQVFNHYRDKQPLLIYFDPKNPNESVLSPGISGYVWVHLILGLMCLTVAFFLFAY